MNRTVAAAATYTGSWAVVLIGIFTDVNPILTGFAILLCILGALVSSGTGVAPAPAPVKASDDKS